MFEVWRKERKEWAQEAFEYSKGFFYFPILNRIETDSKSNGFLIESKTKAHNNSKYNGDNMKCNKQTYIYNLNYFNNL
jgi:hypothetical protein